MLKLSLKKISNKRIQTILQNVFNNYKNKAAKYCAGPHVQSDSGVGPEAQGEMGSIRILFFSPHLMVRNKTRKVSFVFTGHFYIVFVLLPGFAPWNGRCLIFMPYLGGREMVLQCLVPSLTC